MELKRLETEFLGRNLIYFDEIDSTQKKIKSLENVKNGTIIIANNQNAGIGTHDRKWYTGYNKNIAMSFVLYPECKIEKIQNITVEIAKCIVKSIEKLYNIKLEIKEPNDIYYNKKKIGGILTEASINSDIVKKLYIGIGLNVNQEKFEDDLSQIASSLKIEFNKDFDRQKIIVEILNIFEKKYLKMINYFTL